MSTDSAAQRMRLDKWLWAARFYKTRAIAVQQIRRGRVRVDGREAKPAREISVGDLIDLRQGNLPRQVVVRGLSLRRGPATVAQQLYEETESSLALRRRLQEARRLAPEPARSLSGGRPTKRDRRQLDRQRKRDFDDRWSASLDE